MEYSSSDILVTLIETLRLVGSVRVQMSRAGLDSIVWMVERKSWACWLGWRLMYWKVEGTDTKKKSQRGKRDSGGGEMSDVN